MGGAPPAARVNMRPCSGGRAVERSRGQLVLMGGENQGGVTREYENRVEVSSGIEDYIPSGKGKSRFGRVE